MRQKTPVVGVIGVHRVSSPADRVGMEMEAQLGERHDGIYRLAVLDYVEVVGREIHDGVPSSGERYKRHGCSIRAARSNPGPEFPTEPRWRMASVCRTPLPVMLRQIGKSSLMSAIMVSPLASARDAHSSKHVLFCPNIKFPSSDDPSITRVPCWPSG